MNHYAILIAPSVAFLPMVIETMAAELQLQCGALDGYEFYAEENMVPEGQGGWNKGKIGEGESVITLDLESGEIRYQFKDATNIWKTPESQGGVAKLLSVDEADGSFQFIVMYNDKSIELVTISELDGTQPKMIYVGSRNGPLFTSTKLMESDCKYPDPVRYE